MHALYYKKEAVSEDKFTVAKSLAAVCRAVTWGFVEQRSAVALRGVHQRSNMPSKVLYRRVLPAHTASPSTPSHPHKSPPHTSPPLNPHKSPTSTDEADPNRKSKLSDCDQGGCPSNNSSRLSPIDPDPENAPSTSEQTPTRTVTDGSPTKVILSEITEIKGVIFDMDGTLTIPVLKFAEMREKLGLKPTDDILPTVQKFPPKERAEAFAIIEEFEREGISNMKLQPGVLDLFHYLAERDIRRALMTRNAWIPTNAFLERLRESLAENTDKYPLLNSNSFFSEIITREFEPCKPHPAPALHICKQWSLEPEQVMVVGDDKTDMMCGLRAGVGVNILLRNERNKKQTDYSHFTVNSLIEITTLMSSLITVPFKEVP